MMQKKKILITDTAPLYPPLWGGPKRIWNLFGSFSEDKFEITYLGVKFGIDQGLKYGFQKIRDNFREIVTAVPDHYYAWHGLEKIFFKNTSLDLFIYLWMQSDRQFKHILNSQNADIVICSHPWSSLCLRKQSRQFFIYDAHNCEYLLMARILKGHFLKRLVLQRVKAIERDACRKADLILACSEKEKKDFIDLYKIDARKVIIIPNGAHAQERKAVDEEEKLRLRAGFSIAPQEKTAIFVGAYYKPNIEAVRFIIDKIAPELKDFSFLVVGTAADAFKKERMPPQIRLFGGVSQEELDCLFRASDIAINPMFDGSGVNIKMLDYMSYGLPTVTTPTGARGIETNSRQPMIICKPAEFSENIRLLFKDKSLYQRLAEDGHVLVKENYDWKKISAGLERAILERVS